MQKEDPRLLPQTSMTSTTVQHNIRVGNLLHTFNIHTRYKDLKLIGRGAYGLVVSAWDTINNQQVAIKKIENIFNDHHDINASEEIKVENIGGIHNVKAKRILREIKLLRHFQHHQNIITIYDLMVEASGSNGDTGCRRASSVIDDSINPSPLLLSKFSTVYIVSKLMESDLDQIISSPQQLSGKHLKYFLYQILCAIKHVHSANVLHRDLKPSNLLVNSNCDICLCDFGLARGISSSTNSKGKQTKGNETTTSAKTPPISAPCLTEYVVTRWYRAPELLCESNDYGKPADMWSVGCIFAELITRKPFFQGRTPLHQLEMIIEVVGCPAVEELSFVKHSIIARNAILHALSKACPSKRGLRRYLPSNIDHDGFDLISKMIVLKPEERISATDALKHDYFREFHSKKIEPECPRFDDEFEKDDNLSTEELRAMIINEQQTLLE